MLTPAELRGQDLKRYIRAAAALNSLFEDKAIAQEVGVTRMTVGGWWKGAKPEPETIARIADATGLSVDELMGYVHLGGEPPRIVAPSSPVDSSVREGVRRDQARPHPGDRQEHAQSPGRPPRGSGAGRG